MIAPKSNRAPVPPSIRLFSRLFWASTIASIVNILLNYGALRAFAIAQGGAAAGPILAVMIAIVVALVFWFFIARRASNIARWLLVGTFVLYAFDLPRIVTYVEAIGPLYGTLSAITGLLQIGSLVMLFRRDSALWLKSRGRILPVNPAVFD